MTYLLQSIKRLTWALQKIRSFDKLYGSCWLLKTVVQTLEIFKAQLLCLAKEFVRGRLLIRYMNWVWFEIDFSELIFHSESLLKVFKLLCFTLYLFRQKGNFIASMLSYQLVQQIDINWANFLEKETRTHILQYLSFIDPIGFSYCGYSWNNEVYLFLQFYLNIIADRFFVCLYRRNLHGLWRHQLGSCWIIALLVQRMEANFCCFFLVTVRKGGSDPPTPTFHWIKEY